MDKTYSINHIAKIFNITTNKVRFYEKKGLLRPFRHRENNYREYTAEDLARIQTILMYRVLDFSIEDIKHVLDEDYKDNILEHFYKQWEILNDEIHRLRLLRDSVEEIMDTMYTSNSEDYISKIIESSRQINEIRNIKSNWRDKWDFDNWAKTYDISVKEDLGQLKIYKNYDKILQKVYDISIEKITKEESSIKILDIGLGTGNLSEKFLTKGYNIVGIVQSREMLNVAKQKFPQLKVRLGEFLNIPFENYEFDIIVSTYAFHHLNDEEKELAIKEMIRVIKDDGIIVIGDLMFENKEAKEKIIGSLTMEQIEEIEDEYYSDIEKLEIEFRKYNKNLVKYRVDEFNYIVKIE